MGLLALLAACLALGWGLTARPLEPARSVGFRLVLSAVAGWLALVVLLLGLDAAGIAWARWHVGLLLVAAGLLGWRRLQPKPAAPAAPAAPAVRWNLGDGVALAALGVFIVCTVLVWDVHSDFVYHWGVKAHRFYLARGLDVDFLTRPWNTGHLHAEYPNFVPVLFAATALVAGEFQLVPTLLWSAVFFAALLLSGRELLRICAASRSEAAAGMAVLGLVLTMFGVGYLQAGGADWLIALALLAGSVTLLGPAGPGADREIGLVAALAAASKIEGIVLAMVLIAAHLLRRRSWRPLTAVVLRCTAPGAIVIGLWWVPIWRHDLFAASAGSLDLGRAGVIVRGLWQTLLTPNWHGLSFCLLALPLLAADRRLRPAALVCAVQLAFYVAVYFTAATDPAHYIATSAARLFFHVVPTVLLLGVVWLNRPRRDPRA